MPIHDWTRVDAGIFHAFHHDWITEIARALNRGILPADHYALPEQHAAGFGPDVLSLQQEDTDSPTAETDMGYYRRKQKSVTVRHVSGDRIVAMIEIVSPGNKSARNPLRAFVSKAAQLLEQQIHLLIIDILPAGRRDPDGIHGEIWQEIAGQEYSAPRDKPLTLVSYESGLTVRAYVVPAVVGESLTEMPLFLEPEKAVQVPLEPTYTAAFDELPRRWRSVLEPSLPKS